MLTGSRALIRWGCVFILAGVILGAGSITVSMLLAFRDIEASGGSDSISLYTPLAFVGTVAQIGLSGFGVVVLIAGIVMACLKGGRSPNG
jgi:hypothetical protein